MEKRFAFFELTTPYHLFLKLQDDLRALEAERGNSRLAFNFFVTAEHLPDWLGQRELVQKKSLLRIVSHIANGAKHFVLKDSRHQSVAEAEMVQYVEEDYFEPGVVGDDLVVFLTDEEASHFNTPVIDAVTLGRKILEYWEQYLPKS